MKEVFFILGLFFVSFVSATSGVSPGSYEVDYHDGLNESFEFNFILEDQVKANINVEGPLSSYVTLDKKEIVGREKITAVLNLPKEIDKPGLNIIRISARPYIDNEEGIGIAAEIAGIIKINVPYPGEYLELKIIAPNTNVGEVSNISVHAFNRGKVNLTVSPKIQIFSGNDKKETLTYPKTRTIEPFESEIFYFSLNTINYLSGNYTATALEEYGADSVARDDDEFRIGELNLNVLNYSSVFFGDKIEKFDIEVESMYNNPIQEIYAEVFILESEFVNFKTPSINLGPWKRGILTGYLDSSVITQESVIANITVFFDNSTLSMLVPVRVKQKTDYVLYAVITACLIIFLLLCLKINTFIKRVKGHR